MANPRSGKALEQGKKYCPSLMDGPVPGQHHWVDAYIIRSEDGDTVLGVAQRCTECDALCMIDI